MIFLETFPSVEIFLQWKWAFTDGADPDNGIQ
jgi:hypothetical protein